MRPVVIHDRFPTDPDGLPVARSPEILELCDGDKLDLTVGPVAKRISSTTVRMLAYNGSIPGPILKVRQGSELLVDVTNHGDLDTTVHWHGLRLDNRYDGVPEETQGPIPVGENFVYRLRFPDAGLYWYHPHVREDYAQELGLYGNIVVVPNEPDYWAPVDRELFLTLDDLLLEDGRIVPFSPAEVDHAAMGRFGNVFLTGGDPQPRLSARTGEVVRLWLTNTAGARVFNLALPGARMKLVGGDSGRVERAELVSVVLLGPSERAVVDVLCDRPGQLTLEHVTPARRHRLANLTVADGGLPLWRVREFGLARLAPELVAERAGMDVWLAAEPDKVLALVAWMDDPAATTAGSVAYVCPMHPEVTSKYPGRCPRCGMKLLAGLPPMGMNSPSGHDHTHDAAQDATHGGIEWEDEMAEVNRATTTATMHWQFIDRTGGADDSVPNWRFEVGDRVKIRLVNEIDSDHPMHHPFHIHGAGRFLVLARDGVFEPTLGWKDTVLIRTGQTVDILLDVTNPGRWMAHCHIPEHMHSGMMFSFVVTTAS
jgi:FtsP/CotA-like multicopper oxidase with cupredoxin domain